MPNLRRGMMAAAGASGEASVPIDISSMAYVSTFDFTAEVSTVSGISISADGATAFVLDRTTDAIYQYTLSTAHLLSTASYDSVSLDISANVSDPFGLIVNSDGTILMANDRSDDHSSQYSGDAWDLSTFSRDASDDIDFSNESTAPRSITYAGDYIYMWDSSGGELFQYDGTAFDGSTFSYASKSFDPSEVGTGGYGIIVSSDGTKLVIADAAVATNGTFYQYTLSTPFDISTASYDSVSFVDSGRKTSAGIFVNADATKMYCGSGATASVAYQYSL